MGLEEETERKVVVKKYENLRLAGTLVSREREERWSNVRWQVRAEWGEEEKMGWKQARIVVWSLMKNKECKAEETNGPSSF